MPESVSPRRLDAPGFFYEAGRRIQHLSLVMRRHQIHPGVGVCRTCGRPPSVNLPWFGPRCDIAAHEWRGLSRILGALSSGTQRHDTGSNLTAPADPRRAGTPSHRAPQSPESPASGRASVPGSGA